ncbi:putative immunity protein [Novipirellula sp.]|uniref:putative immunity protein n=1 Tax=Novipirellula sp. TaxID=2795430 RepID=UPI003569D769
MDDLRAIAAWVAECADHVLPLFEAKVPLDARPREAIAGIREFANGENRTTILRTLFRAANAAAQEIEAPAASAAARSAAYAASSAFMHAVYSANQEKHLLGPAVYAALAREAESGSDQDAGDHELQWAIDHASQEVRRIVGRLPKREPGRTRLSAPNINWMPDCMADDPEPIQK